MTSAIFKTLIIFLQKYYGTTVNDIQFETIWNAMRRYPESAFKAIVDEVVASFKPTSQVPFPLVHNFLDASMSINARRPSVSKYEPCAPGGEIPTHDWVKDFCRETLGRVLEKTAGERS